MERRLCRRKRGSVQVSLKDGRRRKNTVGMYLVAGIAKFHHALLLRLFYCAVMFIVRFAF